MFNGRRPHAWFKQILKLERMLSRGGRRRQGEGWGWAAAGPEALAARTARQRRRRTDLLSWLPAEPAAPGASYVDALWARTSRPIISQLLITVAFQEPPESLLDLSPRSLESAVQNVSGSKWVQYVVITFSVKVLLVAQSDK